MTPGTPRRPDWRELGSRPGQAAWLDEKNLRWSWGWNHHLFHSLGLVTAVTIKTIKYVGIEKKDCCLIVMNDDGKIAHGNEMKPSVPFFWAPVGPCQYWNPWSLGDGPWLKQNPKIGWKTWKTPQHKLALLRNPRLFDGSKFRLHRVSFDKDTKLLRLELGLTSYKARHLELVSLPFVDEYKPFRCHQRWPNPL